MRKIIKFTMKIRTARTIFALHKMNTDYPTIASSLVHLVHRLYSHGDDEKRNGGCSKVRGCADYYVLTHPRVRMNGIESVVILTLPMHLRE